MLQSIKLALRRGIEALLGIRHTETNPDAPQPLAARVTLNRSYFRKWLVLGAIIGVVAGVGAIIFASAIRLATHLFLELGAGYYQPNPTGEGATTVSPIARLWMIPVLTTLGGLITGLIVFTLAPEAEGHGTDAAIEAFHRKGGYIRPRVPIVKTIASAITIGSGGSAGREGPTAQIAAGFGSALADLLHLDAHDRRIAMAAGVGAGIGSIFKAPLGGALLSAEVLYTHDLEAEAIFPSFIASVVGYSIYGMWAGWTPIFGTGHHYAFNRPITLIAYAVLGIIAGLVGLLYPRVLYFFRDRFKAWRIPNFVKPAIGGLAVGIIGLAFPQALGMGYGWVQFGINNDFVHISALLMLALVFVKILTTALTIGSGGSGGVFGPGMVIGGFLGAAVWAAMHRVAPELVGFPGSFVVVGMGAFFGGVAKAPLAVILMVAEMTNEYSLIVPAMLATMLALLITGNRSIYEKKVPTRLDSPAHKEDYALPLLQQIRVADAMQPVFATVTPETPIATLQSAMEQYDFISLPVVEDGHLSGIVTANDLTRDLTRQRQRRSQIQPETAGDIMTRHVAVVTPNATLYDAWLAMTRRGFKHLPVVAAPQSDAVIGEVTLATIGRALRLPALLQTAASADSHPTAPEKPILPSAPPEPVLHE
jgi:CIC family chloride channel protein